MLQNCFGPKYKPLSTWQHCASHCTQTPDCRAWQWNPQVMATEDVSIAELQSLGLGSDTEYECTICTNSGTQEPIKMEVMIHRAAVTGTSDCKPKVREKKNQNFARLLLLLIYFSMMLIGLLRIRMRPRAQQGSTNKFILKKLGMPQNYVWIPTQIHGT